jgi:hypothetical protein
VSEEKEEEDRELGGGRVFFPLSLGEKVDGKEKEKRKPRKRSLTPLSFFHPPSKPPNSK